MTCADNKHTTIPRQKTRECIHDAKNEPRSSVVSFGGHDAFCFSFSSVSSHVSFCLELFASWIDIFRHAVSQAIIETSPPLSIFGHQCLLVYKILRAVKTSSGEHVEYQSIM